MIPQLVFDVVAGSGDSTVSPDIISVLTGVGPVGVLLVLFLFGFVYSKHSYEKLEADREYLRTALEKEQEAHRVTREALILAGQRADAAVEAATTANNILTGFQRRIPVTDD